MSDVEALEVSFAANIDDILAAGSMIDDIFSNVASSAASSSSEMTDSLTTAAESFSSISDAASQIAIGIEEGVAGATEALSELPTVGEEASSSLSDSINGTSYSFFNLQDAIESLAESVTTAVVEINTQIDSIATTSEEAAAASESSFSGFNIGGMVSSVGMGIFSLQAIGNMAVQSGQSLLGPAIAAENTQASFTNLIGSAKGASDELSQLNSFAAKTQFKTQDIDNAAASMIAFKIPTQTIVPDLTAVGDALTAVGKGSPAEMQSVVDILGKMSVQGHITQGDITQLGSHGINAMSALESSTGLSSSALQDMISKGTLPANQAIADLTTGIEKSPIYAGGMAKQSQTLSGQLSTLSSDFDQVMAAALKPALPQLEQDFSQLTTTLTSPSFKAFAVTMGTDIATGLTNTINGVKTLVADGTSLVDFFQHNQAATAGLEAGLLVLAGVVGGAMVFSLTAMAIAAWAAIVPLLPFIAIGAAVGLVIFGIVEAVQHWSQISAFLTSAWTGVEGFFGGLVKNIEAGFSGGVKNIEGFFSGGVKNIEGFFSGIGGWFHDRGADAQKGIQSGFGNVENFFKSTGKNIQTDWTNSITGVQEANKWLYEHNTYYKQFADGVTSLTTQTGTALQTGWTNATTWLDNEWQQTSATATTTWTNVSNGVNTGFHNAIGFVENIWTDISGIFSGAYSTYIANPLSSLWTNASNLFATAYPDYIEPPLASLWGNIESDFTGAYDTYVSGPLSSFESDLGNWASGLAGEAISWGEAMINGFVSGLQNAAGSVSQEASNIAASVASFLGFHSPAKEGPGSHLMEWGPGLVHGFAQSMQSALPDLQATLNVMMQPVGQAFSGQSSYGGANTSSIIGGSAAAAMAVSGGGNSGNGGDIHVHNHIYLDGQEITDKIMTRAVKKIRLQGGKMVNS